MARQENNLKCTNVFQSASEEERKKQFVRLWIEMVNRIEKKKNKCRPCKIDGDKPLPL